MARNLPDWLVRIYLDKSVYDLLTDTRELLNTISSSSSNDMKRLSYKHLRVINYYNVIML